MTNLRHNHYYDGNSLNGQFVTCPNNMDVKDKNVSRRRKIHKILLQMFEGTATARTLTNVEQDGQVYTNDVDIQKLTKEYYVQLYTPTDSCPTARQFLADTLTEWPTLTSKDHETLLRRISKQEMTTMIDNLPENKSPGPDGIPYELYKLLISHDIIGPTMIRLFNLILDTMDFPPSWSRTIMIMLFKKGNLACLKTGDYCLL